MVALSLKLEPTLHLTDQQFYQLCQTNPELQLERTATGELIIMPPTGGETGDFNDEISYQLRSWNKQTGLGKCFNAATGYTLPNGADRSPDASWIALGRWESLTPAQRRGFIPLAPDFVVELRSPSDSLRMLQQKMQEYQDCGVRLGWLINPQVQQVEIYRPGQVKTVLQSPKTLSGEAVLPGFVLDLQEVFGW